MPRRGHEVDPQALEVMDGIEQGGKSPNRTRCRTLRRDAGRGATDPAVDRSSERDALTDRPSWGLASSSRSPDRCGDAQTIAGARRELEPLTEPDGVAGTGRFTGTAEDAATGVDRPRRGFDRDRGGRTDRDARRARVTPRRIQLGQAPQRRRQGRAIVGIPTGGRTGAPRAQETFDDVHRHGQRSVQA